MKELDDDLRGRFQELRDDDGAEAPAFRAIWDRAERESRTVPRRRATRWIWSAVAASMVLAAGLSIYQSRDGLRGIPDTRSTVTRGEGISTWTSPTASLLRTSGSELLSSPVILSSVLDHGNPAPRHLKGR